ncbi:DUF1232 domain-containing protein [bacterium]|nr:DUF1232 domain-containing protein [bacterium]
MEYKHQEISDFYQRLRRKLSAWANSDEGKRHPWVDVIMLAPDLLHLMMKLAADPEVSLSVKAKLALVIAYVVNPLDLMPEIIIGPGGFADDVILCILLMHELFKEVPPGILEHYWTGSESLLTAVQRISNAMHGLIGNRLFRKLKAVFQK